MVTYIVNVRPLIERYGYPYSQCQTLPLNCANVNWNYIWFLGLHDPYAMIT